ncbi:MAG: thiamine pyrophosphate-dependent enzyme [Actinomycetales bacterium]
MHPAQVLASLPQAVDTMLDPAEAGPAFIGLPQDIGAEAYEYPVAFFAPQLRYLTRPRPDTRQVRDAAALLTSAQRPVIIAGGGVHYSLAEGDLATFAERHAIPVLETVAGKSSLVADHPCYAGPLGVTGAAAANAVLGEADVVLAVGTRLQDFTTGSWTAFAAGARIIALNAARFDARKHQSLALVADAREGLVALDAELGSWQSPWPDRAARAQAQLREFVAQRMTPDGDLPLSYAQVVGAVHQAATADDYVLTAAGGLPGELNINWLSKGVATFDCEYGYSCMGYEISGAWGAAMAHRSGRVLALVGDGSYLMMNSDLYSAVLTGHPFTLVVCDNGGYAVIERLQVGQGGASYNNMLRDSLQSGAHGPAQARVDFAAHAAAMGAQVYTVTTADEVFEVVAATRTSPSTVVIVVTVRESDWTGGGAFWQVGIPEVSERPEVQAARAQMDAGLQAQRRGI